jgi:hypothetical protein
VQVEVDGVVFPDGAAALAFANQADDEALKAAGIKGRALKLVQGGRPWASLQDVSATAGIGKRTLEALANG